MKILHTGDWHVGKRLQGRSRIEEHQQVMDELVELARARAVDLVLVAGDLFDTAAPAPEAEKLVYSALTSLGAIAPVIAIPGNHDNERRLEAVAPLLELAQVNVRPFFAAGGAPLEITAATGERARIALLPWLSQRFIVKAEHLMTKDADDLGGQYNARLRAIITKITEGFTPDAVNILLGHVTVAGGEMGGGERTAQTIFDYWIDPTAFPASAHYVALGHLHKMQRMIGPSPIYYCGSPLQLDFSDTDANRYSLIVEARPGVPVEVEPVAVTAGRGLRTIEGTLDQLRAVAGTATEDYLRIIVKEPARATLGDEVRDLFPNAVKVIIDRVDEIEPPIPRSAAASPAELFESYLAERGAVDGQMIEMFQELYEEASA
ncbi:MAG: exonuclease SbcCD subunit D [Actinomycetota bacterium]|nr:exonuclease SbcCD subunit D [Actinomycetota bacterium]